MCVILNFKNKSRFTKSFIKKLILNLRKNTGTRRTQKALTLHGLI